jgi:hypothetical protein
MHDVPALRATPADAPGLNAITGIGQSQTFEPAAVRYIKLGENGKWAASALERRKATPHQSKHAVSCPWLHRLSGQPQ